jgi:hypothetical protein
MDSTGVPKSDLPALLLWFCCAKFDGVHLVYPLSSTCTFSRKFRYLYVFVQILKFARFRANNRTRPFSRLSVAQAIMPVPQVTRGAIRNCLAFSRVCSSPSRFIFSAVGARHVEDPPQEGRARHKNLARSRHCHRFGSTGTPACAHFVNGTYADAAFASNRDCRP